jgi:hypothetical protein
MSQLKAKILTKIDEWLDFFTPFVITIVLIQLYWLIKSPTAWKFILMLVTPYLLPLICFRISKFLAPIKEGPSYLGTQGNYGYQPWNATFKMQQIFYAFPFLERVLILLGLYSVWLRLWGSKIGKNILWTARTEITDRSGVEIGDNCFFGHECILISHVVKIKNGKVLLYYKRIKIGNNVFIGAGTRMGPGVVVENFTKIPVLTDLYVNQKVSNKTFGIEDKHELEGFFSRT